MDTEYITIKEAAAALGKTTQSIYQGKKYRAYVSKKGFQTRYFDEHPDEIKHPISTAESDTLTNTLTKSLTKTYQESYQDPYQDPQPQGNEALIAELRAQIAQLQEENATAEKHHEEMTAELRSEIAELRADKAALREENKTLSLLLNQQQQLTAGITLQLNAGGTLTKTPTEENETLTKTLTKTFTKTPTNTPTTEHKAAERAQEGRKTTKGNSTTNPTKTAQKPPQRPSQAQHKQRSFLDMLFRSGAKK